MGDDNSLNSSKPEVVHDAPLVCGDDPQILAQELIIGTKQAEVPEEVTFGCEKCEKKFSKEKARDLHMTKYHNTKSINYTLGPVTRKIKVDTKTCLSIRCTLCTFICKSNPSMKKHVETHQKKNMTKNKPEEKKSL